MCFTLDFSHPRGEVETCKEGKSASLNLLQRAGAQKLTAVLPPVWFLFSPSTCKRFLLSANLPRQRLLVSSLVKR